MTKKRLIAVIIVRNGSVVQSEQFKHTNVIHYDAIHAVEAFSSWDVDEIIILNVSSDNKSKENFLNIVKHVSSVCFVPLSAGGHIDDIEYGKSLIQNGADKLIINSAFHNAPDVPMALSRILGKQCIVASIDTKPPTSLVGVQSVHVDRGRKKINDCLADWITHVEECGAGELFLNNIINDGNRKGYDLSLIECAKDVTNLPVIIFGGAARERHFADGLTHGADAVAAANYFHYKEMATKIIKKHLKRTGFNVREQ